MSDYTQITSFAPKDSLTTGDPNKKIRGSQLDPEFSAIATAILSKFDSADVASDAEAAALTSDTKLITPNKLAYALQNATLTLGSGISLEGTDTFPNVAGAVTATHTELNILDGATLSTTELNVLDGATLSTAELNILDGVTATAAELNKMDGFTGGATDLNNLVSRLGGIKVAYGVVSSGATLSRGSGVTSVSDLGTGQVQINYTAAGFTQTPTVVASISGNVGFISISTTTSTTVNISTYTGSEITSDMSFAFMAIGV